MMLGQGEERAVVLATKKLDNERFVSNAPEDFVAQVRETKAGLLEKMDKTKGMIEMLSK